MPKQTLSAVLGILAVFAASAAEPREYPCYPLKAEPVLDGKIEDACWKDIPEASGFYLLGKDEFAVEKQTTFKAGWTKDALFLAITCFEDVPRKMAAKATAADGNGCWADDSLELFFAPPDARKYFQMAANSAGARANLREDGGVEQPWDWQVKADVGPDRWIVEARIPFAVFQKKPADGARWMFNVARNLTTGPAAEHYTCWPPLKKEAFNDLPNFAALAFKSAAADQAVCREAEQRINGAYREWVDKKGPAVLQAIHTNEELSQIFTNWNLQMEATPLQGSMQKLEQALGDKAAGTQRKAAALKECMVLKQKLMERAKTLGLIGDISGDAVSKLAVTFEVRTREAAVKLLVNGKEVVREGHGVKAELKQGINVVGIAAEAQGKNPGVKIELTGHPEASGRWRWSEKEEDPWMRSNFNDQAWAAAQADANGYVWGTNGNAGKLVFRQVILWNAKHDGPQHCINPLVREWGFSEDSLETLFLTLYSPLPFALEDFEFELDIPACFRMMEIQDLKAAKIIKEDVRREGRDYRRYRLFFPPDWVSTNRTYAMLLPVRLGKYEKASRSGDDKTCRFYFRRQARGNFTELQQSLPVRILPPINGKMPKNVFLQLYAGTAHNFQMGKDHLIDCTKQAMRAGFNCWFMGWWPNCAGTEFGEKLQLMYRTVADGGAHVVLNTRDWPLYGGKASWFDDDFFHWLENTPAARARHFEDSQSWTNTGMFCPAYVTSEGARQFRAVVKNDYAKMLAGVPQAEIIWVDWESWPWVQGGHPYGGGSGLSGQGSWCFCERCKKAFRTFAKLPETTDLSDAVIFKDYKMKWIDFRSDLDGRIQGEIRQVCHELGRPYMMYSWTVHTRFWEACKGRIDLAFPGCPGNGEADSGQQKHLDETMAFFRDKLGMKRVIGQRFSFFENYEPEGWKNWHVLAKDGYVNAKSWKPQVLRIVAALHGGMDLCGAVECCAGMQYYIGEAARIISEFEPLFYDGERADQLAECDRLGYPNLLVLKKGDERLVLLFNEDARPMDVVLKNKELAPGQTAVLYESSLEFKTPDQMRITVPPEDVAVVHIFPHR